MNWNGKEALLFLQQKEYIDTAIIPLVSADFGPAILRSAEQYEFIQLLAAFIEKQFKGRVLVTPPCSYLPDQNNKIETAARWVEKLKSAEFQHVFFFTSDSSWKTGEEAAGGFIIVVPSIPLRDMEEKMKYSLIENQAKQVINTIVQAWQYKTN